MELPEVLAMDGFKSRFECPPDDLRRKIMNDL